MKINWNIDGNFCQWYNENKGQNAQPKIAWKLEKGSSQNGGPQIGNFI